MGVNQLLAVAAAVVVSLVVSVQGQSSDFPMYKLSLSWPATLCMPQSSCRSPIPSVFTIHGLWPSCSNGKGVPAYDPCTNKCSDKPTSPDKIITELQPLMTDLRKYWPSVLVGKTNEAFWKHEWSNHGMCSDFHQKPKEYFSQTLNLAKSSQYDALKALGVQPSSTKSYELNTLLENVKKAVKFYPEISCSQPYKYSKELYLKELRFCFKRGNPVSVLQDCPERMDNVCKLGTASTITVMFPPVPTTTLSTLNATEEELAFI